MHVWYVFFFYLPFVNTEKIKKTARVVCRTPQFHSDSMKTGGIKEADKHGTVLDKKKYFTRKYINMFKYTTRTRHTAHVGRIYTQRDLNPNSA